MSQLLGYGGECVVVRKNLRPCPKYNFQIVLSPDCSPGLLQKMSKKCNSPVIFTGLVVFLGVFFRKFPKIAKKSQQVTVRE